MGKPLFEEEKNVPENECLPLDSLFFDSVRFRRQRYIIEIACQHNFTSSIISLSEWRKTTLLLFTLYNISAIRPLSMIILYIEITFWCSYITNVHN
jgi:hypothetical protein